MVIFCSILNDRGLNSCIIRNENNSSKINEKINSFLKTLTFELIHEQLEESAEFFTLPIDLRAEIHKLSRTETDNLPPQKEKRGMCQ